MSARVSKITIARLYSLGNYNHMRYEIAVDVPEGADAAQAARRLQSILWDLRPVKVDPFQIGRAQELIAAFDATGKAPENSYYGDLAEAVQSARELLARRDADKTRRATALAALKDFGGTDTYTDAKDEWDQDDE